MIQLTETDILQLLQRTAEIVSRNSRRYIGVEAVQAKTKKFLDLDVTYYAVFSSDDESCQDCTLRDKCACDEEFPCEEMAGRYGESHVFLKKIARMT